jgi:hypothetical protein
MSPRSIGPDDELSAYVAAHSEAFVDVVRQLPREAHEEPRSRPVVFPQLRLEPVRVRVHRRHRSAADAP